MQVTVIYRPVYFDDFLASYAEVEETDSVETMLRKAMEQEEFIEVEEGETLEDVILDMMNNCELIAIIRGKADFIY